MQKQEIKINFIEFEVEIEGELYSVKFRKIKPNVHYVGVLHKGTVTLIYAERHNIRTVTQRLAIYYLDKSLKKNK